MVVDEGQERGRRDRGIATADSTEDGETASSERPTFGSPRARDEFLADADGLPPGLITGSNIDRFEVIGKLGEGGMGVVVSAYDPTLERKVAIKLLRAGPITPATRTRLLREAQAMARVAHEAIVAVYEVGFSDGRIFVVMELIDGETLARWQKTHGWREVLDVYLRAGRGLAAAHAAGLVHRDFKPANVLVGHDGRVRVTDFGLVAASGSLHEDPETLGRARTAPEPDPSALHVPLTRTGDIMGTPAYMAPEQYLGKATDARADQFSFCVAVWEGLYQVRPYDARNAQERREKVVLGELGPAPTGLGVPAWIEPILRRGLHPDPDERWPDMGELLRALADDPDARRTRARRTALLAGGVATVAAAAAVAGTLMVRGGRSAPCQDQGAALAGIWDGPRRQALVRALAATGKPYAVDAAARIAGELDGRAHQWIGMRTDACLATAVAQTQSEAMLDRRMACLDRRRAELGATVELITRDAAPSLPRALDAVLALPPLDACDPDRVMTSAPPPADPAARAAIAAARADLDRGTALVRDGRTRDALAPAAAAVAAASRIAWPQLSAEALGLEARARLATGDAGDAEPELHAAIAAASTAGDAELQAELTVALVELANHEARYDDVVALARLAEASLGSADHRWRDRAALETELGRAALARQQLDAAGDHFGRALELRRRHAGSDSLAAARSLEDLADTALHGARFREADTLLRQVLAIEEHALGPRHPEVATTLTNLSTAAKELARYDEGAADLGRAIDILIASEGDDSPRLAAAWSNLGVILGYQARGDDALAAYQKSLAIRERTLPPDHPDLASSIMNVGIALQEDLHRPADAIPYFERARDLLEHKLGPDHPSLAYALHGLGSSYLDLHQPARGVADLERAYRLRSRADVDPQLAADSGYMLAQALWQSGRDRRRAGALAHEAAAIYRRLGDADGARQIDAWAAAHR